METKGAASRSYGPGEVIFREGDAGNCMYSVERGTVEISTGFETTAYRRLTVLREGDFFGEMGMVRGYPRSATASAGGKGAVIVTITWGTLSSYFKEEPAKIVLIMQQLSRRIAELTDDYIGACGEIAHLLEERAALEERLHRLRQTLDAELEDDGQATGAQEAVGQEVAKQEVSGQAVQSSGERADGKIADEKAESPRDRENSRKHEDSLKKYMDAYRRYQSEHGVIAIDDTGVRSFYA